VSPCNVLVGYERWYRTTFPAELDLDYLIRVAVFLPLKDRSYVSVGGGTHTIMTVNCKKSAVEERAQLCEDTGM
jgi:hypothetical protein